MNLRWIKAFSTSIKNALYGGRELTLNALKSGIFPIKATKD